MRELSKKEALRVIESENIDDTNKNHVPGYGYKQMKQKKIKIQ